MQVRSIPVTKRGVYFAVRDEGACLSLIALRVYYITCPNVTLNHAFFPETPTAADITAIVAREGRCVPNAQMVETPRLVCKGDGEWTLPTGGCKCRPGHEAVGHECKRKFWEPFAWRNRGWGLKGGGEGLGVEGGVIHDEVD